MVIDFDELAECTDVTLQQLRKKNNVQNFNKFVEAVSVEAFSHIVEKAREGSAMCIVELFKTFKPAPEVKTLKDLSNAKNFTAEELEVKIKQLEFKLKNLNFKKLTVTAVVDAFIDEKITKGEHDLLINMIRQQTYATRERELQSDIVVNLSKDMERSLYDAGTDTDKTCEKGSKSSKKIESIEDMLENDEAD